MTERLQTGVLEQVSARNFGRRSSAQPEGRVKANTRVRMADAWHLSRQTAFGSFAERQLLSKTWIAASPVSGFGMRWLYG
jgi:hypothetical protein